MLGSGGAPSGNGGADVGIPEGDRFRGIAEIAFDVAASPFALLARLHQFARSGREQAEISKLSLHYSSANQSEEESSSLINILDRKKYHERIAATRSADEQMQPR